LISQGGGRYTTSNPIPGDLILLLADAANDAASAEAAIRRIIGARANTLDYSEVIVPLAQALLKAKAGRAADAVREAAIAVESCLARLAQRVGVNLSGANGIIQKLDKFRTENKLPKKITESAKYLGQIRNAADHGIDVDPDVGAVWHIQENTGYNYVFVACSFIASALEREAGGNFII
jgi:hypothetical protein